MAKTDSINVKIFTALKVSELSKVPVFLLSNPGVGKSTTVEIFAELRGYDITLLRGNSTSHDEILGYMAANEKCVDTGKLKHCLPDWYTRLCERRESTGKPALLFLDELTTASEFVQSALLQLIFGRQVDDEHKLPEDTLIVAAGNYASNLSGQFNLLPPVINRFMIVNLIPEISDIKTFMTKFKGAVMSKSGKVVDSKKSLLKVLSSIDDQDKSKKYSEKELNIIGEKFESCIIAVSELLCRSAEKKIDLSVTDFTGIYSDSNQKVFNFYSFRTMNYLRDVSIATYLGFGKDGINSNIFQEIVDGLCGIGYLRGKGDNSEPVYPYIGKLYTDALKSLAAELDKLGNKKICEYQEFVVDTLKSPTLTIPEIQALTNKIKELKVDEECNSIEKPIDGNIIRDLLLLIQKSANSLCIIKKQGSSIDNITVEELSRAIVSWNMVYELVDLIKNVINNPSLNYDSTTKTSVDNTIVDLRKVCFKLSSFRKYKLMEDKGVNLLIPEIKTTGI